MTRKRTRLAGASNRITPWVLAAAIFVPALLLDAAVFDLDHQEGDEWIYRSLVGQLEAGKGYTLQGHPIVEHGLIERSQYDRPLFHHPPAGIGLFWLFFKAFGPSGFALAQLASFAIFFWSVLWLARLCIGEWTAPVAAAAAIAAGFDPIVTHVTLHYWLEGPQLAFATLGSAVFVWAVLRPGPGRAGIAGVALAFACLVKLNAVLLLPLLPLLALAVAGRENRRQVARITGIAGAVVFVATCSWLVVQYREYGELFPAWAGKPSAELVRSNRFIQLVTVDRGAASYLWLLPQGVWTLTPALLMLGAARNDRRVRHVGLALLAWIAGIVAIHVALGAVGYSKLLRYVILVVPATVALFGLGWSATLVAWQGQRPRSPVLSLLLLLALAGLGLEVAHSLQVAWTHPDLALIDMLFGARR